MQTAKDVVSKVVQELGRVDVLVNNASIQHYCDDITNITNEQLAETFQTNVFGYFYFAQVRHTCQPLHSSSCTKPAAKTGHTPALVGFS
jgi:NADP-dependent 3-hydroxy acid dehydrogenase YdfG